MLESAEVPVESADVPSTVIDRSWKTSVPPGGSLRRVASAAYPSGGCDCHRECGMIAGCGTGWVTRAVAQPMATATQKPGRYRRDVIRRGVAWVIRDGATMPRKQAPASAAMAGSRPLVGLCAACAAAASGSEWFSRRFTAHAFQA